MGLVVDVKFDNGYFLVIYNVFKILYKLSSVSEVVIELILEVVIYLGDNIVCIVVMLFIDGLVCGLEVEDIGVVILVLVGDVMLGCVFNVLGEKIDLDVLIDVGVCCDLIYC